MGAVHPLAEPSVSAGFPEKSPENRRLDTTGIPWNRDALVHRAICRRTSVSLQF